MLSRLLHVKEESLPSPSKAGIVGGQPSSLLACTRSVNLWPIFSGLFSLTFLNLESFFELKLDIYFILNQL